MKFRVYSKEEKCDVTCKYSFYLGTDGFLYKTTLNCMYMPTIELVDYSLYELSFDEIQTNQRKDIEALDAIMWELSKKLDEAKDDDEFFSIIRAMSRLTEKRKDLIRE